MPDSLFKIRHPGDAFIYLPAAMLARGSKIVAADGISELEVTAVTAQQSVEITQLHVGEEVPPLRTTPNHRIMIPGRDGDTQAGYVPAGELSTGDSVMCALDVIRQLTHVETRPEATSVFAISFHPDEPVAAFRPPPNVILSLGLPSRRRRTRRSGMNRRGRQHGQDDNADDNISIPDTAPGPYAD